MNAYIPLVSGLMLSTLLFLIGLIGALVRRNFLFVLLALELMTNAAALAFVVGGSRHGSAEGQAMFLLAIAAAAVEAVIGLALLVAVYRRLGTLDLDRLDRMKG